MFNLDRTKFSILSSNSDNVRERKSSNLPRPRLSKKNVKIHSDALIPTGLQRVDHSVRVELESASCDSEREIFDFDYDYASLSDCDSGHQSGCGSAVSLNITNNKLYTKNGLLAPTTPKSARFRSVSFTEEDEDGYSYVSYASGKPKTHNEEDGCKNLGIIGTNKELGGPFGPRKCVYLDQGRAISGIENFIGEKVLSLYSDSSKKLQLTEMREEARQIIHKICGEDEDETIFCGDCGPIQTLINSILKPTKLSPIVILGPFQSFNNIRAWERVAHKVIHISMNSKGSMDLLQLESILKNLKAKKVFKSRLVIGSVSAGSNVTGTLNDDVAITEMLHKYGAYSVWDYADAGPHVEIRMNPKSGHERLDKLARKDAIFISAHKFPGGPQTPDVLIIKKSLLLHNEDSMMDFRHKSALSCPNIIGEIRFGLVFKAFSSVESKTIIRTETGFTRQVLSVWEKVPEILILGATQSPRLPIVSFIIKHPETGYFLHHEFVAALLRDLFGIQSGTGLISDAPHVQQLLGIDKKLAKTYYEQQILPGFNRLFFPHTSTKTEIIFAIEAVKLIANNGFKLLPFYEFDLASGTFRFSGTTEQANVTKTSIKSFNIQLVNQTLVGVGNNTNIMANYRYDDCLNYAKHLIDSIEMITQHNEITHHDDISSYFQKQSLRWFITPSEALLCIKHPYNVQKTFNSKRKMKCPFMPKSFEENNNEDCGSIAFNYAKYIQPTEHALQLRIPPRLVKSSSLKSLDMELKKSDGFFSRREFKSQLNHNYFGYP